MADDTTPPPDRRDALKALYEEARGCMRCAEAAATRQNVVFGAGRADAALVCIGEAPGATEDGASAVRPGGSAGGTVPPLPGGVTCTSAGGGGTGAGSAFYPVGPVV